MAEANQNMFKDEMEWRVTVERDISGLQTALQGLGRELGDKFSLLQKSIESLRHDSKPQPTNFIGVGSLVVAVAIMMFGYVNTRLSPLEQQQVDTQAIMIKIVEGNIEQARADGFHEGKLEVKGEWLVHLQQQVDTIESRQFSHMSTSEIHE
jgi:hypothetical protein